MDKEGCVLVENNGTALPFSAKDGEVPPREIVAVVRPANVVSSSASKKLDQKHIVKNNLEMIMEVGFIGEMKNLQKGINIYAVGVPPTSTNGYQGLYIFEFGCKLLNFFQNARMYRFSFHLDILIESYELDKIQPHHEATLVISPQDELASVSIPYQVIPRSLKYVTIQSPNFGNNLLPCSMVKQLKFEINEANWSG
ncbi:hypothetical protein Pint_30614 [Pistacia integerrima]|uniref:Uncharacterized protein n=1 Tax=Pistacia integerrima TaxID=434235 RepID=A0ACC0X0T8_9ROSI|nr:hypothetical protein Pint_30614 [Pistacia integerrima]